MIHRQRLTVSLLQVLTESGKVGFTLSRGRTLVILAQHQRTGVFHLYVWQQFLINNGTQIIRVGPNLRLLILQAIVRSAPPRPSAYKDWSGSAAVAALRGAITSKATIIKRLKCVGSPEIISLYPQVQWFHYYLAQQLAHRHYSYCHRLYYRKGTDQ